MAKIVSVFGGSKTLPGEPAYEDARALGEALARAGWTVATGGYMGVMEAASRGACEAGGHVIGVTCSLIEGWRGIGPNRWVKEEIKFPTLRERLAHLVEFCDAAVALPGGIGTLSELALTWSLMQTGEITRKPFVAVGPLWTATVSAFVQHAGAYLHPGDDQLVILAARPEEAVRALEAHTT
jgi:uncharacterized protein (TIGR00730 family)